MAHPNPDVSGFRVLQSSRVYDRPPIPIRQDIVQTPHGQVTYTVLEYHDACAAVAITEGGKLLLVKVVRHPTGLGHTLWELPGGRLDAGESPEQCIRRELEEETGYLANQTQPLLPFYFPEPSHSTETLGIFLMSDLQHTGRQVPEGEGIPEVGQFSLDEAYQMILDGDIRSSWSVIGVLAAKLSYELRGEVVPLMKGPS